MTPEEALDQANERYCALLTAGDRGGSAAMFEQLAEVDVEELQLLVTVLVGRDLARARAYGASKN